MRRFEQLPSGSNQVVFPALVVFPDPLERMDPMSMDLNRDSRLWIGEVDFPEPLVAIDHVVVENWQRQPPSANESQQLVFQLAVRPFPVALPSLNQSPQNPFASPVIANPPHPTLPP